MAEIDSMEGGLFRKTTSRKFTLTPDCLIARRARMAYGQRRNEYKTGVLAIKDTSSGGDHLHHEHVRAKFLLVWQLERRQSQCQNEVFGLQVGDWYLL